MEFQGPLLTVGRGHCVSWGSNHLPYAEQPLVSNVLPCHNLSASLGAQGFEFFLDKEAAIPHQATYLEISLQLFILQAGPSGLCPGIIDNLQQMDDAQKTAIFDREFHRLDNDVDYLQETHLADCGTIREKHYIFFWKGKAREDPREHCVGFAITKPLLCTIEPLVGVSERLLKLCMLASSG